MRARSLPRRSVLRAASFTGGLAALAGCGALNQKPPKPPPPDPELVLLREAIAEKRRMAAIYRATAAKHPELRGILADHLAHLTELERRLPATTSSPSPASSTEKPVKKYSKKALGALEREAAKSRPDQAAAASPSLAQLLASIGASEAYHAKVLA